MFSELWFRRSDPDPVNLSPDPHAQSLKQIYTNLVFFPQFGARVLGSDIDYLMLHAKTKPSRVGQKKRTKGEHLKGI